ncbi:DUF2384 domain-containing protein [Marinicauda salina]|uniref:DUF2384 domain-containing protein n=2 Tax=Marinicauda salina TaxID=2135793 RepID=A0A2U2BS80_9PROT|nr:DUF2384 domain-containing protein [Marinicauda salina]
MVTGLAESGAGFEPKRPERFSDPASRKRLNDTALKAYRRVAAAWNLSNAEAAALLDVSSSSWDRIKAGGAKQLGQDQLTRVSALIGIYKALHLLVADDYADRWPKLPNSGPLFDDLTPVQAMIEGGIPLMLDVRRYVDAVRGGL